MAHLLLIELPGGDDTDVIDAILDQGHSFTFLTADLAYYRARPTVIPCLERARNILEVSGFDYAAVETAVLVEHAQHAIDGVLCLVDIRMIEASRLAQALSLPFLNPDSARLLRDKYAVRQLLDEQELAQPLYRLATDNRELRTATETLGLPLIIKPTDGYGSQNVVLLRDAEDLNPLLSPVDDFLPQHLNYGFGVWANDRLLVERFIPGPMIGCDTLSINGRHHFLGINEKLYFPAPSFAIRGSCFPSDRFDSETIQDYVTQVLDAVGFDWGMAHLEIVVSAQGPMLVEINPRLVGARIPRLLNLAFQRSIHADLVALHLGQQPDIPQQPSRHAVSRWFAADRSGTLSALSLPTNIDPVIACHGVVHPTGSRVQAPRNNGDRIGFVMTTAPSREIAEDAAEAFIREIELTVI